MPEYFEYALKASLCLAIVFIFYNLLLKQLTWYKWNRFFLLAFSVFSFIVPFISLNVLIATRQLEFIPLANYLPNLTHKISANPATKDTSFNYWQLLSLLYVIIGLLLFVRLLIRILSIRKIKSGAILISGGEVDIYHLPKPILPFSFLNSIFINKHDYTNTELQEIIDHERVHVQQKHTIDVLVTELICIVNWYNPFAWLIKIAIRENLEFIADDAVIQKGFDRKNYQYLLLKVKGILPSPVANNFSFTSLKNRIRMMNKTKTGRLNLLRFVLVFPLAALLLLAFRNEHKVYKTASEYKRTITKAYILASLTYVVPDKKVEAEVKRDAKNCLLKTGDTLNLDMVFNEKTRLVNLLQGNGHNNIDPHAITFMIDTTLENNSFSIQVNINLIKDDLFKNKEPATGHTIIDRQINSAEKLISPPDDRVVQDRSLQQQNEAR